MNRSKLSTLWMLLLFASLSTALAQQDGWPRSVSVDEGVVTIYSLQAHEMTDDFIRYRAALAYRSSPDAEPVFGAGWFESRIEVDQAKGVVHPLDLKITDSRFPAGTVDIQPGLAKALAKQSSAWNLDLPLDELQDTLKTAEAESDSIHSRNTTPPRIIYRDHPALLVMIDGKPVQRDIENSPYEAVINTPYPLITDGKTYYLNVAKDVWYRAGNATGPYRFDTHPPTDIAAMVSDEELDTGDDSTMMKITAENAPEVVVSTEPAELVVTEGPAAFVPLVDDLLVLQNSEDDVFMHVSTQQYYIVLAGRWYYASNLNGPWTYQAADALPPAFADIPKDSDQADSRVYIAGTEEAHDAVLEAYVPQTATVAKGEVDIDVVYDGEPNFEPVDGADLEYADNTGSTVLQSDRLYYLVEDGVWYVSTSPDGPWQVSDYRPQQVETILPSSPVYNVKYVYVYDSTPEVVYVGYTPGYMGSYVYHDTIVYGTGWYYRPWISPRYYYPRHRTWGFNVHYDPWYGWNYGLSWGWGPFSIGYYPGGYWHENHYWHHRYYGYWGPRGYRHRAAYYGRHRHHKNRYNRHRYGYNRHDRYRHRDYDRGRDGYDRYGRHRYRDDDHGHDGYRRNRNLYRDDAQRARIADTRDRRHRSRSGRGDIDRQASYTRRQHGGDYRSIDGRKIGRERTGPVRPADLAVKARLRDANSITRQHRSIADNGRKKQRQRTGPVTPADMAVKASLRNANSLTTQRLSIADNGGKVNRGSTSNPQRRVVSDRSDRSKKAYKSRITPLPRTGDELLASRNVNSAVINSSRNHQLRVNKKDLSKVTTPELRERKNGKRKDLRRAAHDRKTVSRTGNDRTRQRSTAVNTPARQVKGWVKENTTRQRVVTSSRQKPVNTKSYSSQRRVVTTSRQASGRADRKSTRQKTHAPIRMASARAVVNTPRQQTVNRSRPQVINTQRQQKSRAVAVPARQPQPRVNHKVQRSAQAAPAPNRQQSNSQKARGKQNRSVHQGNNRRGRARN